MITADYTIIMSRTLKVTGNHVTCNRSVQFLRLIMSSSRALCCVPSVKKQKHDYFFRWMYSKTTIRFSFCDIQKNRGLGKGYQPQALASADNPYLNLDYSGYHKKLIQYLFIIWLDLWRKKEHNLQNMQGHVFPSQLNTYNKASK